MKKLLETLIGLFFVIAVLVFFIKENLNFFMILGTIVLFIVFIWWIGKIIFESNKEQQMIEEIENERSIVQQGIAENKKKRRKELVYEKIRY